MPADDLTDAEVQRAIRTASDMARRLGDAGDPLADAVVASLRDVAHRLQPPGTDRATPGSDMTDQDTDAAKTDATTDEPRDQAPEQAPAEPSDEGEATEEENVIPEGGPITAKPNRFFNGKWIVFGLLLIAGGGWFAYDGFIGYPAENERIDELNELADQAKLDLDTDAEDAYRLELRELGDRHSDTSIRAQILLGFLLPVGGLALIGWTLWAARSEVRLDENDTLHVAGHPPVPLSAITDIDDERWEKKGVSRMAYEVGGQSGVIKLDDFIFDRPPTDKIHDRAVWVHQQKS
ncbi:MAG: hypothetical protein AAGD32_10880 [Planctomycetota bacterium]